MNPEAVRFFSLQIVFIAAVLVLNTYIGLHIVRRTLIFSDLVLDQLAAFGAMVGIGIGIEYGTTQSFLFSTAGILLGSLLLALIKPKSGVIPREAVIGIMYAMALVATLLLGDKMRGGEAYVTKTLSGSMLWVTWPLVRVTIVICILLLLFCFKFHYKFVALAENPNNLKNQRLWDFLLFTTQGIITVFVVPVAGVLLDYSFLMIPAAIAVLFTPKWAKAVIIGWTVGFVACMVGLCSSYFFNWPYGPSLVLSLGLFFVVSIVVRIYLPTKVNA
jgi:zinc/manganese transport system permease protein